MCVIFALSTLNKIHSITLSYCWLVLVCIILSSWIYQSGLHMKSLLIAVRFFSPRLLATEIQLTYTLAGLNTVGGRAQIELSVSYKKGGCKDSFVSRSEYPTKRFGLLESVSTTSNWEFQRLWCCGSFLKIRSDTKKMFFEAVIFDRMLQNSRGCKTHISSGQQTVDPTHCLPT